MKIVDRVLQKRIRELAKVDDMQFGFMPGFNLATCIQFGFNFFGFNLISLV